MQKEKDRQKKVAKIIVFCAVTAYIILNCVSCVKSTGHSEIDTVIEEFSDSYKDDNIFEEALENKIQDWSGFELDLSPRSEEK